MLCGCAQVSTGHTRVSSLVERWETGPGLADVFRDAVVLPDPQDDCHWFPVLDLTCIGFLNMMSWFDFLFVYICTYLCICPSWPCWISDRCCTGGLCPRCCHDIGPVRFQGCKSPDPEETHGDIMKYHPYLEISLPKESQWYRDTKPLHWSEGMKSGSQQLPSAATSSCQGTGKMGLFPERFAWHCNCEPPGCWPFVWGALAALAATRIGSHLYMAYCRPVLSSGMLVSLMAMMVTKLWCNGKNCNFQGIVWIC